MENLVTTPWPLNAREVAHAMPVLHALSPELKTAPAPGLAVMRGLARRNGVKDGALRTALSRACAAGSLETTGRGYRLGPLSLEEASTARALLNRRPGYALAVVLEGETADLPVLREIFARFGFRPLQRSVWVGARTADDRLTAVLDRTGFRGAVVVFQADEVDAAARRRLAAAWDLPARSAALHAFRETLMGYLTAPGIDAREAAWRCVETAPVWYRIAVQEEPPFPLDLLGPDYPLEGLNADWRAQVAAASPGLLEIWRGKGA